MALCSVGKKTSFGLGTILHCLLKCTGWIYFLTQDSRGKWRCTSEFPTAKYQKYHVILVVTVIWVIHPMYWNWKVHILPKYWGHQGCCSPDWDVWPFFSTRKKGLGTVKFQKQSILFCQLGDITAFTVRIFRRLVSTNSDCNRASKILHLLLWSHKYTKYITAWPVLPFWSKDSLKKRHLSMKASRKVGKTNPPKSPAEHQKWKSKTPWGLEAHCDPKKKKKSRLYTIDLQA